MYFGKYKGTNEWYFSLDKDDFETYKEISDKDHLNIISQANNEQKLIKADDDGNPILVDRPEPSEKEKAKVRIRELEQYLVSTDWYAIRLADEGTEIPEDVKTKRRQAREEISQLREKYAE